MGVYETATKLASEIKISKEYKSFKKSMDEVQKDKSSEELLKTYRSIQIEIQNYMVKNQQIDKKNQRRIEGIQQRVSNNKIVSNYLINEQKLNRLMENINKILAQAIENDYRRKR
ncbi:MAG: YlbF family regulator [Romboutsia sp.]